MAAWKAQIAGVEVKIRNVDHGPPHCHAFVDGRDVQIDLYTFCILKPPPHSIPANLRKGLAALQGEMLEAWERVTVIPPGSSPGDLVGEFMTVKMERPTLSVDISEIGHHGVRQRLTDSLDQIGCEFKAFTSFWTRFPHDTRPLPRHLMVGADLAHIAKCFRQLKDNHAWVTSVRKSKLFFVAFVRTKEDERQADLVDELVRYSDARIAVCRALTKVDVMRCIHSAVSAFDPTSLITVRYSAERAGVGVEFGDGLFGFVSWEDLRVTQLVHRLVLESATVGPMGRTMELLQTDGELFEVDSTSLRAILDKHVRQQVSAKYEEIVMSVGERVRAARVEAGLTQQELGSQSGIDQALLSKLERGQHQPRYDTLARIASCFGVSVPELLATPTQRT